MITPNQFTVQAGSEVTVNVTNNGTIEHDFNIIKFRTDVGDMFDEEDQKNILWEINVQLGETKSVTFTVPDQGIIYQVVCAMPGHLQAGMLEVSK